MTYGEAIPYGAKIKDLTGLVVGKLTVLGYAGKIPHGKGFDQTWHCRCACGNLVVVRGFSLTGKKKSRSCGCGIVEAATTHGLSRGEDKFLYDVHRQMLSRCYKPSTTGYENYGGRGIQVCKRWRESIHAFLLDVGEPPTRKHTIDRVENDGHYSCGWCEECQQRGWPFNVRWATRTEQNQNRRDNRLITLNGETLCMSEWAKRIGLRTQALWSRLDRGWPLERALTEPRAKRFSKYPPHP